MLLIFQVEILIFVNMSLSICRILLDWPIVGDMPPWMIGHEALYQIRHHFRLQDIPQVLRRIILVLLQVLLWVMMSMLAALGTLLMTPLQMMIPLRPSTYCCTMMMQPLRGHAFVIFLVFCRHCPLVGQTCRLPLGRLGLYVLYCLLVGFRHVFIILPHRGL